VGLLALGCSADSRPALVLPRSVITDADDALRAQIAHRERRVRDLHAERAPASEVASAVGELGRIYHGLQLLQPEALALLENARLCYGEAHRLDPSDWRWPYLEAAALQAGGELEAAARRYRAVPATSSNTLVLPLPRPDVARQLGRTDEAAELWQRALALDPSQAAAHYGIGLLALDRGQPAAALGPLERALRLDPDAGRVQHALAIARRDLGDLEEARAHLSLANETPPAIDDPLVQEMALLPVGSRADLQRGLLAVRHGAVEDAVRLLSSARDAEPGNRAILRNLAIALSEAGDQERAIAILRELARMDPRDAWAEQQLGRRLVQRGGLRNALPHLERAVELAPRDKQARLELGVALAAASRPSDALRQFEAALDVDPFFADVLPHRATALAAAGQPGEAERLLLERLGSAPGDGAAARTLSRILRQQGRLAEAREGLENALAERPGGAREEGALRQELGRLLALADQPARALVELNRARRLAPDLFEAAFLAGLVQARLGRFEGAEEAHRAALATRPDFHPARLGLAEVLAAQGQCARAREVLKEASRRNPADRSLGSALASLGRSCVEGRAVPPG